MSINCLSQHGKEKEYKELRNEMVEHQIVSRGVKDTNVLNAMRNVERHLFIGKEYKNQAYNDYPIPIDQGQTISQPYIVAIMTEMLGLDKDSKVLEIGTGSGYQAAVLAEICDSVYTIEIFESLGNKAVQLLRALGYKNVKVKIGDGYEGWPEHAPFDGIIVTCAPTKIPQSLIQQIKEGGRLVIPVGEKNNQTLYLFVKKENKLVKLETIPVRFVPMINKKGENY